jgi:hypothetical protein
MDKLKKYFKDNEASMKVDVPDENSIWGRIESGSIEKHSNPNWILLVMRYAAAACFILLIGLGLLFILKDKEKPVKQAEVVKDIPPVINDTARNAINQPVITETTMIKKAPNFPAKHPKDENILPEDEVDKIGKSYTSLINLQLKRLRTTAVYAESPGYFNDFKLQLKQMDKDEAMIRSDMKLYGFSDQLLEQLINVYQQKLNLLKNLQAAINKMNNGVKEKEQPSEQAPSYYIHI